MLIKKIIIMNIKKIMKMVWLFVPWGVWHPGGTSAPSQAGTLRASALQECLGIFQWLVADDEVSGVGTLLAYEPTSGGDTWADGPCGGERRAPMYSPHFEAERVILLYFFIGVCGGFPSTMGLSAAQTQKFKEVWYMKLIIISYYFPIRMAIGGYTNMSGETHLPHCCSHTMILETFARKLPHPSGSAASTRGNGGYHVNVITMDMFDTLWVQIISNKFHMRLPHQTSGITILVIPPILLQRHE